MDTVVQDDAVQQLAKQLGLTESETANLPATNIHELRAVCGQNSVESLAKVACIRLEKAAALRTHFEESLDYDCLDAEMLSSIASFDIDRIVTWDHNQLLVFADGDSQEISTIMTVPVVVVQVLQQRCRFRAQKILNDARRNL